jgi:HlyD family secretion protein
MSKDLKPKQRLGQTAGSRRRRLIINVVLVALLAGGAFAAYRYTNQTEKVEVSVARVRRSPFVISVKTRGEIRSVRSVTLTAPQVPMPRIVRLAESGRPIKKGEVVVEFDAAQQEQNYLDNVTNVRTADSEIVQTKASHQIVKEQDSINQMTANYNVDRAKLDASKAEVVSAIEGAKSEIDVGVSEGDLSEVKTTVDAHGKTQKSDLDRLAQRKDKTVRDAERTKSYLALMVLRAPNDGIVNILPNFRASGSFGSSPPAFKEGDQAWTGAAIAEIPDLSEMRVELKLDEVDRGKMKLGQGIKVRVDAIADRELNATLDWISPIAAVNFKGMGLTEKTFPARATLKNLDPRLRPGMSASAEVVIESEPNTLLIPVRASFMNKGKPSVYIQHGDQFTIRAIEVGKRNDTDIIVLKGLKEGEQVALENPIEAAKKAKKL